MLVARGTKEGGFRSDQVHSVNSRPVALLRRTGPRLRRPPLGSERVRVRVEKPELLGFLLRLLVGRALLHLGKGGRICLHVYIFFREEQIKPKQQALFLVESSGARNQRAGQERRLVSDGRGRPTHGNAWGDTSSQGGRLPRVDRRGGKTKTGNKVTKQRQHA